MDQRIAQPWLLADAELFVDPGTAEVCIDEQSAPSGLSHHDGEVRGDGALAFARAGARHQERLDDGIRPGKLDARAQTAERLADRRHRAEQRDQACVHLAPVNRHRLRAIEVLLDELLHVRHDAELRITELLEVRGSPDRLVQLGAADRERDPEPQTKQQPEDHVARTVRRDGDAGRLGGADDLGVSQLRALRDARLLQALVQTERQALGALAVAHQAGQFDALRRDARKVRLPLGDAPVQDGDSRLEATHGDLGFGQAVSKRRQTWQA